MNSGVQKWPSKGLGEFVGVAVVSFVLVLLLYGRTLIPSQAFQSSDDRHDQKMSLLEKNTLRRIFDFTYKTRHAFSNTYYEPLRWLNFYVFNKLGISKSFFYHLLQYLLHGASAVLIYYLARSWIRSRLFSLLACVLFLCMRQASNIFWWVTSTHVQCSFWLLLSLLLYSRYCRTGRFSYRAGSILAYALAWFSKPAAVFFIVVLWWYDFLFGPDAHASWRPRAVRATARLVPYGVIQGVFIAIGCYLYPHSAVKTEWGGVVCGFLSIFKLTDFLSLVFMPFQTAPAAQMAAGYSILFACVGCVLFGSRRLAFLCLWLVAAVAPFLFSNFHPTFMLGRYLYYASVPFALLVASQLEEWARMRWASFVPAFLLVMAYLVSSFIRMSGGDYGIFF